MKKNKIMRLASVLCILVLLTTSIVSGTFAKYTTTGSSTDTARVAKWGVTVTTDANPLFKASYDVADADTHEDAVATTPSETVYISQSVTSANGTDTLVAPGTSGTITAVNVSGTPEVAVEVTYVSTLTLTGWTYQVQENGETVTKEYMPLVITVTHDGSDTVYKIGTQSGEYATIALLTAAVKAEIDGYSAKYSPNTNLASTIAISWEWAFSTSAANDVLDTTLGNAVSAPTITFALTTTVTQID